VEFGLGAHQGAAVEEDVALAGPGRTAAMVAGVGSAPALAVGLEILAAVPGGVKSAAVAWGLVSRFTARSESRLATAYLD
jgi:hypothetical protein